MQEEHILHGGDVERRILLVAPGSALRDVLEDYLRQRGFHVRSAPQVSTALGMLRRQPWDGVVIDWQMGSAVRWVGEAVGRTSPQARLVVMMPQAVRLRWGMPQLEAVVHPFRPSQLAHKLGAWTDGWLQEAV